MRIVESSFNIFEHGRTTHNNRPYLLAAVKRIIESDKVQEALKLEELYGYYGHGKRQMAAKLTPSEVEVVTVKGKQVVIDQVPSNVCVGLSVDDKGNVTHKQRILDTNTGLIVDAMESSGVGGWSWAASGDANNFKGFGGFDYVKKPSYISNEKRTKLMLESVGVDTVDECIIHNLKEAGLSQEESQLIFESWEEKPEDNLHESTLKFQCLMLESVIENNEQHHAEVVKDLTNQIEEAKTWKTKREQLMLESLETLPIIPNDEQKAAFINMANEDDIKTVAKMFESVQDNLLTLPTGNNGGLVVDKGYDMGSKDSKANHQYIDLSGNQANPFSVK